MNNPQALALIEEVFNETKEIGFIVRAKKEKVRKTDIIGYLIKYVASPPIALYRITGYDGEYVQYWYREHPTDRQVYTKLSAFEFIAQLIQHIPPKGLKLVRHYGLYARNKFKKVKQIIDKLFKFVEVISQGFAHWLTPWSPINYRARLQNSFHIDPFKCPKCGEQLVLYEVWHPKFGVVYNVFRDEDYKELDINYVVEKEAKTEQQKRFVQQDSQLFLFEMQLAN
jgi:hypothetical protein